MNHHHQPHAHGTIDGRASRFYDALARSLNRGVYRRIAADLSRSAPADAAVLDIGTGPGVLLQEIHRARPDLKLTGVDLSADMVEHAQRNLGPRAAVQTADVAELPFETASFDLVVSSFSAHHWEDPDKGATEIARILRPGGRLLIYDFERAPFDVITREPRLADIRKARFRTGRGRFLRCERFEATATAAD